MSDSLQARAGSPLAPALRQIPLVVLGLLPLPALQFLFDRMVQHVARAQPRLFARLGVHAQKTFLIDPSDLPFTLLLKPRPEQPQFQVCARRDRRATDARIAGGFFDLLAMLDSSVDGDALFFSRGLRVTGDIEAVVALRNALDDLDGNIVEVAAEAFGPMSRPATLAFSALRALGGRARQ